MPQTIDMSDAIDIELKGRFKLAIFLTAVTFIAEFIGGFIFNSLALLSDSAHVFMDVFALSLSWLALYICAMPPQKQGHTAGTGAKCLQRS
ncbi:MAG: hypothetical protein A3G39_00285 [Deltaproteobacteria bacterium RIFCSPLOWO2_12_FULL_43_16]|nr:MAG: hypothetical protein A3G39_00285 [Deltaproteobacteria bacterium RIFCSPLOWO2_12_FULL_43_16]